MDFFEKPSSHWNTQSSASSQISASSNKRMFSLNHHLYSGSRIFDEVKWHNHQNFKDFLQILNVVFIDNQFDIQNSF